MIAHCTLSCGVVLCDGKKTPLVLCACRNVASRGCMQCGVGDVQQRGL